MAVILKELYEGIRKTEKIDIVAGSGGLNNVVRWVHMVENTDISAFLEGDEVAFTTGIALDSPEDLLELVKYNCKQKAAGMVINIGPYIKEIPDNVIEFGNENEFPVFCVPWKVHMANIMRYFSCQINMAEQRDMEIGSAIKNAVYFSENEELYVPALMKYGYKREWSYAVAAFEIYDHSYIPVNDNEKKNLVRHIKSHFREWGIKAALIELEDNMIIFFANCSQLMIENELNEVWKEINTLILPDGIIFAGIGRNTKSMKCIGRTYRQAEQIKNLQKKRNNKNNFVSYKDLGMYKLLLSISSQETLEEYYNETLGKLEKFDHINETDYMYFLKRYFEKECSIKEAAESMHMHRNSVTYKLHRIEQIMDIDINTQETKSTLLLAFMIKELK